MKETFLKKLIKNMEIQSVRIKLPPERNQDFPDLGLRNTIFGAENPFSENMPEAVNKEDKIKVWMAEDIFRCHYIIEIKPREEEAAIIGPYRIEDMGISEISRRFDKLGFKNINMQYLTRYYHLLPHIRDLNLVYFIVQDHFSEIYGEDAFD
ncbi:hypothetical protein QYZ88_016585 [Lachnospiraceae bacterium C1.1]|nr:hypothetical protein [Lachnospiraceae bacterium C1.1]